MIFSLSRFLDGAIHEYGLTSLANVLLLNSYQLKKSVVILLGGTTKDEAKHHPTWNLR